MELKTSEVTRWRDREEPELWKDIPDYEGLYQASSYGRIRNASTLHIRKAQKHLCGYLLMFLYKKGEGWGTTVHSLVARTFLGEPPEGHEVNHKDLNKHNCRLDNLEYMTHQQNIDHAVRNYPFANRKKAMPYNVGSMNANAKLNEALVLEIRRLADTCDIDELTRRFCVSVNAIRKVIRRKTWKHI